MSIIIPIVAVTVIGIVCGVMLVVASKFMAVPEDEKFVAVRECLPGANCGACGYAGCDGYAHALADGEVTETTLCVPGGADAAAGVAAALGVNQDVLCFGLLIGATLGGNLTPVGASANIAAGGILRKAGYEVSTGQFMKIGVPFTLAAVLTGYILAWFLYV